MSDENNELEFRLNELSVQKINLQPNDVLMVTVNHDDVDMDSIKELRNQFNRVFPNNEVMIFAMGSQGYVKFTIATQNLAVDNASKVQYCSDCNCGKKPE